MAAAYEQDPPLVILEPGHPAAVVASRHAPARSTRSTEQLERQQAVVEAHVEVVHQAMSPWRARHMFMNFADTERDPSPLWSTQSYDRLRRVKARVDPADVIRSNHPVPPAAD